METKTIPCYVDRPMEDEWSVKAVCIDKTGSKQLHYFSIYSPSEPVSPFKFLGRTFQIVSVERR